MHELRCAHDVAAVDLTDALMPEAHTEYRNSSGKCGDHSVGKSGVFWSAGPGTNEHAVGSKFLDLLDGERVASMHERVGTKLAQVLDKVEDERVVVIEDEDACGHRRRTLSVGAGRA